MESHTTSSVLFLKSLFFLLYCVFHHGLHTFSSLNWTLTGMFWGGAICGQLLEGVIWWEVTWWEGDAIWCRDDGEGVQILSRDTVLEGDDLLLDGDTEALPAWWLLGNGVILEHICDVGSRSVTSVPMTLPGTIWTAPKNWGTPWALRTGTCCTVCGTAPGSDVIGVPAGMPTWSWWLAGWPLTWGCDWRFFAMRGAPWRQVWRCSSSLPRVSEFIPSTWLRYLVTSWAHSLNPALYFPTTVLSDAAARTSCWRCTLCRCLTVISRMSAFSSLEYWDVWNEKIQSQFSFCFKHKFSWWSFLFCNFCQNPNWRDYIRSWTGQRH